MEILSEKDAKELIRMHQEKALMFQEIYDAKQLWSVEMFVILPEKAITIYLDLQRPEMLKAFRAMVSESVSIHVKARLELEKYLSSGAQDIIKL